MACLALPSGRLSVHQIEHVGKGPADEIIMIHGLGANSGFWYATAVHWFRRFGRVTLFDLPGHGESDMPASGYGADRLGLVVAELMDHLQIGQAHVVAHSFGGMVALALASQQPERVKSLVLADVRLWSIEPPVCGEQPTPRLAKLREAGLKLDDPRYDVSVQVLIELARLRLEQSEPGAAICEVLPGVRSLFPGKRSARRWLQLIETTHAYEQVTDPAVLPTSEIVRLKHPMLAIYGGLSSRKLSAMALEQLCAGCNLHVIPDAGHFFPLTRPRIFSRAALAFLREMRGDAVKAEGATREQPPLIELTAAE